jgi:hypothetical protein
MELLDVDGPRTRAWDRFGAAMTAEYEVVDEESPTLVYPDGERSFRVEADLSLTIE